MKGLQNNRKEKVICCWIAHMLKGILLTMNRCSWITSHMFGEVLVNKLTLSVDLSVWALLGRKVVEMCCVGRCCV